jgi:hypothetical protein
MTTAKQPRRVEALVAEDSAIVQSLRDVIVWARDQAENYRVSDPTRGRAASLVATHTEDALRVLLLPNP